MASMTKKFQAEAQKQVNALSLWVGISCEDSVYAKLFASQAEVDACAHVAAWYRNRFKETYGWAEEARHELVAMGLKKE